MARYPSETYTSCDQEGVIVPGATITVTLAGTSTPASVYMASAGGTAVSTFLSDSVTGAFQFWIDITDYPTLQYFDICITKSISPVLSFDPGYITNVYIPMWEAATSSSRDLGVLATRPSTVGWGVSHSGLHWFNLATANEEIWNGTETVLMG